jgi:hypothetical protein
MCMFFKHIDVNFRQFTDESCTEVPSLFLVISDLPFTI